MNDPTAYATQTMDAFQSDDGEDLRYAFSQPDLISDDDIDYDGIIAASRPGHEGGRTAFDTRDYATEEEAMAALEPFMMEGLEEELDENLA